MGVALSQLYFRNHVMSHLQCDEASLPQRITDLQCYSQNADGIFNLVMDVLLHQLLAHPQTQTAHCNAPE